jgi:hypothetical protein
MQWVGRWGVVAAALLLAAGGAGAQTNTGEIAGVVRDTLGGVLPGATVSARHPETGFVVERVTERDGRFFLAALPVGRWEVTATLPGFAARTATIVLEIGRTVTLELTLGLAGLSEEVRVATSAPLLQTHTAEISDVIENREVVQLPLNGRNSHDDRRRDRRLHAVSQQPDTTRSDRSSRDHISSARRTADVRRRVSESDVRFGPAEGRRPVQSAARRSHYGQRPAARPVRHIRCRRSAAVRRQRAAGSADPWIRAIALDGHAERRLQPHATLRAREDERAALRLSGRRRGRNA